MPCGNVVRYGVAILAKEQYRVMLPAAKIGSQEFVSAGHLIADKELFAASFDHKSFEFQHKLTDHPAFRLDRLMELARETQATRSGDLYYDSGIQDLNHRWDETTKPQFSAAEAIQRIENCGAWIVLKRADKDPEYREILNQCMAELQALTGLDLDRVMKVQEVILFITSPKRITTYHIDRECSILLQIRGSKQINIFDRDDRDVLPEEELECFWSVDHNAPRYKPQFQDHAEVYKLTPGTGVHIPVNCPHWLQNGDDISISLNVNFQYRDAVRANIYRANYFLRRLGFVPTPPGQSATRDRVKSLAVLPALWARNIRSGKAPWS